MERQTMGPKRTEKFDDILHDRRRSSDLSHALRNFTPTTYKGKTIFSASTLNRMVLKSQNLCCIIQQMSEESGEPEKVFRERASSIMEEMSQNLQLGYIRFLGFVLSKVFKRLFRRINVNPDGLQKLRQALEDTPVVLIPNHRSYMDFLVLSYVLFTYDLSIPVIASGIAVKGMRVVGEILRKAGAFYIRRSIRSDKLYWTVLSEYVNTIVTTGYAPMEFYIEGLRSRTLKCLTPKLGMLSMILEPFIKGEVRDITLVPISLSYDRVIEEYGLAYEVLGFPKPKLTTQRLLKSVRFLGEDCGNMHVYFHPVSMRDFVQTEINHLHIGLAPRNLSAMLKKDTQAFVSTTGHVVVRLLEQNMVLSPWSLMATILMQNLQGMKLGTLIQHTLWLKDLLQCFGAMLDWPDNEPSIEVIASSLFLHGSVARYEAELVVLVGQEPQGVAMPEEAVLKKALTVLACASYRNQALHVFVRPALVELAMHISQSSSRVDVLSMFRFLQDLFYKEFVFVPGMGEQDFEDGCLLLVKCGAIQITDQKVTVTDKGLFTKSFFKDMMGPFVDAYQVVFRYLCAEGAQDFLENEFPSNIRRHAVNLILSGELTSYEALSLNIQQNVLASLQKFEAVTKVKRGEKLFFTPNKTTIKRIADILAGKIPPKTTSQPGASAS